MRKIIEFFKQGDKQLHILAAFAVTSGSYIFFSRWNPDFAVFLAFVLGCAVSLGKEAYDMKHPATHDASHADLIADGIGIAVAIALTLFAVCVK